MEIAAAAGGALLSISFEKLLDKLGSSELLQFASKKEVQSELHKWEIMLPMIQGVLEDAEHKETTSRLVKAWLSELRDLVYDVEDVMDEFATEALRIKHQAATSSSSKKKVQNILPSSWFTKGSSLKLNVSMGSKLREITARLETICTKKTSLDLGDKAVGGGRVRAERIPATSIPDSHIFGRDKDRQAILDLLLADGDAADAGCVSVIPIQGMGGLGKTTLAQQLYNDEKVKAHFQLRAWVCVSDTFDILGITRTILQYVCEGSHTDGKTLDQLQVDLEKKLSEKKFFIVLDDVWNEKYDDWTILRKPFSRGATGSKIIVTTRNQKVVNLVGTTQAYPLEVLSSDDCLSLFSQHALGATNFDGHPNLKEIGQKIVEKCKGLPLAAKTLGGLLRNLQRDEWEEILKSQIWDLPEEKSGILPSLRISYYHLPSQVKQCFAYCAIFPKDYRFDKDELVLLWMAEGFLSHPKRNKRLEDVGTQYFGDLLSRSFFQPFNEGGAEFVMHDLIHDLAQDVAGEICFHLDASVEKREHLPTMKTRHLSFIQRDYEVSERFGVFDEAKGLRTLLTLPIDPYGSPQISVDVLNNLLSKLGNLRALSLRDYLIPKVPDSVNRLKHIRYLNLSKTSIRFLPEFVCSLLNLQTLLLKDCRDLEKLPVGIRTIPNLCHLDISGTIKLEEMPPGIGNLTKIQSLGKFIVGSRKVDGLNIRELKNLSQLKGELFLEGLHNVEKSEDAREADLKGKQGLQGMVMRWSDNMDDHLSDGSTETKVLEFLQPHRNVERLAIMFYCGLEFPSWIGDPLLMSNMTEIKLSNCWKSALLPSLGSLPMLKHLIITGMSAVKTLGFEFSGCDSGGFATLETLKFEDMHAWERWCSCSTSDASTMEYEWKFPSLHELEMLNCPVLVVECLVSLPSLRGLKLENCNKSFLKCMVDIGSLTSLSIEDMSGLQECSISLPSLRVLKLKKCNESFLKCMVDIGSLTSLSIEDMSGLQECSISLPSLRVLKLKKCNELFLKCMVDIGSLTSLSIEDMSGLSCLNDSIGQLLVALEDLEIRQCEHLVSLWRSETEIEDNLTSLKSLKVRKCPELVSLMTRATINKMASLEEMIVEDCPKIGSIQIDQQQERKGEVKLPPKLRCLELGNCGDALMERVGNGVVEIGDECALVDYLEIRGCDTLQHLAIKSGRGGNKVRRVHISNCRNLVSLSNSHGITVQEEDGKEERDERVPRTGIVEIEELRIYNCPSLTSDGLKLLVPAKRLELSKCSKLESVAEESVDENHKMNMLWTTVEDIVISDCPNLKSLADRMNQLTNLTRLWLWNCDGLELFPERGLPFPNLSYLSIKGCGNLKSMPNNMQCLTTLRELTVFECGGLKSFAAKGSLPPNLIELFIRDCPNVEQKMSEWKLDTLSSLEALYIRDVGDGDFKDMLLPTTLRKLTIGGLPKLEYISSSTSASSSKGFHLHTNLTSLAHLRIYDCPKLRCLPKEGLPPTLETLHIIDCPIIEKKCREGKGKYWSRISLIPFVSFQEWY